MLEDNGRPKLGQTATTLGIRERYDIETDSLGMVHPSAFTPGGKNGLSCAPEIHYLPPFALPIEWGGRHQHTKVWKLRKTDLSQELVSAQDGPTHVSIGPAQTMSFQQYANAIANTAAMWVKVSRT